MNSYKHSALLTDLYEFTMAYAYFKQNRHEDIAYFDMFVRTIPDKGGFILFNGLNQLINQINDYKITEEDCTYLRSTGFFDEDFLDYLSNLKLSLDIWSIEEGTPVFANEPLVTVRGPLLQTQLIETLLLLSINYATLVTTKARRIVEAAKERSVLEFGIRRAQGIDASVEGARAAYIAGAIGTSNTLAGQVHGIPVSGTMAHSFIQMHESE